MLGGLYSITRVYWFKAQPTVLHLNVIMSHVSLQTVRAQLGESSVCGSSTQIRARLEN